MSNTVVTGTVLDAAGTALGATVVSVQFVGSADANVGGASFPRFVAPVVCNNSGQFSITVTDNSTILPVNSQWRFQFCPPATDPQCYQFLLTISGASVDISSQIQIPTVVVNPSFAPRAYQSNEINNPKKGSFYWDLNLGHALIYDGSNWVPFSTNIIAGVYTINGDNTANQTIVSGTSSISVGPGGLGVTVIRSTANIGSINGDQTVAQTIVGQGGISVATSAGVTTISGPTVSGVVTSINGDTAAAQTFVGGTGIGITNQAGGQHIISVTGVTTINGLIGPNITIAGAGAASISAAGSTVTITVPIFTQVNSDWNANFGPAQILNKPAVPPAVTFSQDLSGTPTSQLVVGLRGKVLDAATVGTPSDGWVITYDGASGTYKAKASVSSGVTSINSDTTAAQRIVGSGTITVSTTAGVTTVGGGGGGFTAGGDLSGSTTVQTVVGLRGKVLDSATVGTPTDGWVITYDGTSGTYKAKAPTGGGPAGSLSAITAAVAVNSIANASFTQVWNWALTSTNNGMVFGESAAGTGTGSLVQINGLSNAVTPLDIEAPASVSAIHFGILPTRGGWLTSFADVAQFSGGAQSVGALWTARATSASILSINPASAGGGFFFYGSAGLTAGSTFSPSVLMSIALLSNGNVQHQMFNASGQSCGALIAGGTGTNNNITVAGGAHHDGTNWIADSTGASILQPNGGGVNNGGFIFYGIAGLTAGNTFAPPILEIIAPAASGAFTNHTFYSSGNPQHAISSGPGALTIAGGQTFDGATWTARQASVATIGLASGGTGGITFGGAQGQTIGNPSTSAAIASIIPFFGGAAGTQISIVNGAAIYSVFAASTSGGNFAAGAHINAAGNGWIADTANNGIVAIGTNGSVSFYVQTGQTPGSALTLNSVGNFTTAGLAVAGAISAGTSITAGSTSYVSAGYLYAQGGGAFTPSQGAYIQWNRAAGTGEMDFVNNHGGGAGGWFWWDAPASGTPVSQILTLDPGGNLLMKASAAIIGSSATPANFVSGGAYNGASWVAQAANYANFVVQSGSGGFSWYSATGLTVGNTFAPSVVASMTSAGLLTANGGFSTPNAATISSGVTTPWVIFPVGGSSGGNLKTANNGCCIHVGTGNAFSLDLVSGAYYNGTTWFATQSGQGLYSIVLNNHYWYCDAVGASTTYTPTLMMQLTNLGTIRPQRANPIVGYTCQPGINAGQRANQFNIDYTTGSQLWIDATNLGTITVSSDYRLKENIEDFDRALPLLMKLRPVSFNWRDIPDSIFSSDGKRHVGFIAHEVGELLPGAVTGEFDEKTRDGTIQPQGILDRELIAVLCSALQELARKVEALETSYGINKRK
jgi:hypothetical protein